MQDLFCFLQMFFLFHYTPQNTADIGDSSLTFTLKYNNIIDIIEII